MSEPKPIPQPPHAKVRRAEALRAETIEYCREKYFPARWWKFDKEPLDYEGYVRAWEGAQTLERWAQGEQNRIRRALENAEDELRKYPEIKVGGPATEWLRRLTECMRDLQHFPPEAALKPSLRAWFRDDSLEDIYEPHSVRDWTVLAVSWWILARQHPGWQVRRLGIARDREVGCPATQGHRSRARARGHGSTAPARL